MANNITLDKASATRVRIAVFTFFFMQGLCFSNWASRIPDIKNALGLGDAVWGSILFMIPVGQVLCMVFSGRVITRLGSRRVLVASTLCYALSLVACGLVKSELALSAALVVFGFFANFCNISVNTQGVTVENFYGRPIMATFHGGWSLAGLVGGLVGLLMTWLGIGPATHFYIILALVSLGVTLNYRYLQPDMKRAPDKGTKGKARPERFLYLLGVVGFFGMASEGSMTDWNGLYLQDVVGARAYLAPLGLAAYMVTMATGRFLMDGATERWGMRTVLQVCGACIFAGLLMAVLFPTLAVTLVAFMVVGLGTCGIVPAVYSVTGRKTGIPTGVALTIVSSISFLGFLIGPPVIGYISSLLNLRYSYALIATFGICIAVMASRLRVIKD